MVSLHETLQKSLLKQCDLLFINAPFPGQEHADQISIWGWVFLLVFWFVSDSWIVFLFF